MVLRETENNAYEKIWGDKKHHSMLWFFWSGQFPTPETLRGMGTRFRRNDSWGRLGGLALIMIVTYFHRGYR